MSALVPYGTLVTCEDGHEWVYVGFAPVNTVGHYNHVFIRTGEAHMSSRWDYNAVYMDTLLRKFPSLKNLVEVVND